MARTKGTYSLPANIETNAAAPLDARSVVVQKSDLTASGSFPYPYIGMQVYVRSEGKRYTLIADNPTVLANWHEDTTGGGAVDSVNGQIGTVVLDAEDVGLGNVDNTSDVTKKTNFTGSIANGNTGFVTGGDAYTALGNKISKSQTAGLVKNDGTIDTTSYQPTEAGKGLSSNDYTNADKAAVGNIPNNVTDLSDVSVDNIQNGQILKWDSNEGKFVNANESGGGSVNNAYKSVKVGSTTISASGEDTIELSAGNNISLTPDAINKKVTINATGGVVSKLSDLSDVYLPNAQYLHEGEFLGWDSTMQEWQDKYPTLQHEYSTTEKIVGTWVDGKSVYEKTYVLDNYAYNTDPRSLTYTVDVHSLSIDTLVSLEGIWERYSGNRKKLYYTFGSYEKGYAESYIRLDSENGYTKGKVQMGLFTEGTTYQQFTIRYTKTTN